MAIEKDWKEAYREILVSLMELVIEYEGIGEVGKAAAAESALAMVRYRFIGTGHDVSFHELRRTVQENSQKR